MTVSVGIGHFLIVGAMLFCIGFVGLLVNRRNILVSLIALEVILLAISLLFITFSKYHDHVHGQVISLFIIGVAAAEAAVGLAILIVFFRFKKSIKLDDIKDLKG
jgi:NADH-quinone oxidoreductase subunit K